MWGQKRDLLAVTQKKIIQSQPLQMSQRLTASLGGCDPVTSVEFHSETLLFFYIS